MKIVLLKLLIFGHLGLLIEIWFTALHAVIFSKDRKAPGRTYLWMIPIYGFGGWSLGLLRDQFTHWFLFIPAAVSYIFAMEFFSGLVIKKIIGTCPWDYGQARFGLAGLVRLDYIPFWLLLALGFDMLADKMTQMIEAAGRIVQ